MRIHLSLAAALLLTTLPASAGPAEDFKALLDEHWEWSMRENPLTASSVGDRRYDAELGDFSLEAADRRAKQSAALLKKLEAIPDGGLSTQDRTSKAILRRMLREDIEEAGFGQRMITFSSYSSPWQWVAGLGESTPFRTRVDYESYLSRLEKFPAANDTVLAITARGVKEGYVQPCVAVSGIEGAIRGVIAADPAKSRFYAPFAAARPAAVTEAEWSTLQTRAQTVITARLNPAYAKAADYMVRDYLPKCAKAVGVSNQPRGRDYYALQIRRQTTTDLSAEQIHQIGLSEVARIRAEMDGVAKSAGFPDRGAFVNDLRTNPKYYAATPEALMQAAARIAKTIDGKMPGLFVRLPRLPYGTKEIPAEIAEGTTTAYYMPGSPANGIAGFYFVNTSKLDQRPLYELPALTVHEAVPGHHHQIALQQELDLPLFRRHLTGFTAYVEGWGLYAERLGIEMGLYDTPDKQMGRLSYEMWRASRLVVDTGIHAKGWTKEQAARFMLDNTALSAANIDAEVNRYISWPGQALGYKLGELKIRELRTRAEQALGAKFDLRQFHDAVLDQGAVPLDVLDAQIEAWIAAQNK
ncbi:DUF885 domain-containing protein [Sphingomonas turrisvirgatae]|uniref:DUF885 domain-containing protein n=1 Tax=Sphingomonas turrisvirgatae TaxID=1888892 RepID=A0A1E3LY78_9SPHN|nr:DUF885 domain-containing protein [Sphingomonas turrisvirgatae]ODP38664.1 hypothetical protein BFL28_01120 [Sphingomonas turrisvirgatae]